MGEIIADVDSIIVPVLDKIIQSTSLNGLQLIGTAGHGLVVNLNAHGY